MRDDDTSAPNDFPVNWRIEDARRELRPPGPGPLARLLIAFVLCGVLAIICWVVVPLLGAYIPPIVPLLGFAAIALGTLLSVWESRPPPDEETDRAENEAS